MALSEPSDVTTVTFLTHTLWNTLKSLLFDAIGNQEFTEQNYITNDESVTSSLDALDQEIKDQQACYSGSSAPSSPVAGQLWYNTTTKLLWVYNGSSWVLAVPYPRSHLAGLVISNNSTDAEHDIDIAVGECEDAAHSTIIALASALTKQIDAEWAAGTDAGGMFTGSVAADTWYHVFLIKKPSTNTVDAGFDTSLDPSANLPTDYTKYRRIGSVLTDSDSNIIAFTQLGDEFLWADPPRDINVSNQGNTAVSRTLSVPPDIQVRAKMNIFVKHDSAVRFLYVSPLDVDDEIPDSTSAPLATIRTGNLGAANVIKAEVRTDTSKQVRTRADGGSTTVTIATLGWVDRRGQDD